MKNILLLLLLSLNIYSQTIESYFEIPKDYKGIFLTLNNTKKYLIHFHITLEFIHTLKNLMFLMKKHLKNI